MRIVFAILALLAISFALSNRQPVEVGWWPLPDTLTLPLYLVMLALLLLGWLVGRFGGWLAHRAIRRGHRDATRRVEALQAELARHRPAAAASTAIVPRP